MRTKCSVCYSSDCMLQLFLKIVLNTNLNECIILKRQKQNKQKKKKNGSFIILCLEKNGRTVLRMTFLFDLPFSSYSSKTNYQAPVIKSFLYHLCHICDTCNFCYISYTDVPCWSYFDLTFQEMGRNRQKTTLALFAKAVSLQKPILLLSCPWEVPCCFSCQSPAPYRLAY